MSGIKREDYEVMRAWSALMVERVMPMPPELDPELHPIACLDKMAVTSPARARQGLAMMVGDLVEASHCLQGNDLLELDASLREANLPTLSDIRVRLDRQISRVLKAGKIKTETDYYAVRNSVDGVSDEADSANLWKLLAEFEARSAKDSATPPA